MSYFIKPKTEEELDLFPIVDDGIYDFEVLRSTKKLSKSGNEMAELKIKFWDKKGAVHTINDYLVFADINLCIRKIKHFCEATGLKDNYDKGEIPEQLGGYSGKFKIGQREGNPKPDGGFYAPQNIVEDYVKPETESLTHKNEFINDELPF